MTVRAEIEKSIKSSQRGMRISSGDQFWRGLQLVTITGVGGKVDYTVVSTGEERTLDRPSFFSRSLLRVPHGKTKRYDFLRQIYQVISNKKLSIRQRVSIGKKYARFAKNIDDAKIIRRWLVSLAQGEEPKGFRGA